MIGIKPPKGVIQKTVKKGSEPKSSVSLRFYGDFEYKMKNRMPIQTLCQLLNIKLREVLREEKGGTYGVQVYPSFEKYPRETYAVNIGFGCGPDKLEELTKAAMDVIDEIKKNGCNDKDLTKIKETLKREREVNLKENRYWSQAIGLKYSAGENFLELNEYEKLVEALKGEDFKNAANLYLNTNQFATFKLLPEK